MSRALGSRLAAAVALGRPRSVAVPLGPLLGVAIPLGPGALERVPEAEHEAWESALVPHEHSDHVPDGGPERNGHVPGGPGSNGYGTGTAARNGHGQARPGGPRHARSGKSSG